MLLGSPSTLGTSGCDLACNGSHSDNVLCFTGPGRMDLTGHRQIESLLSAVWYGILLPCSSLRCGVS